MALQPYNFKSQLYQQKKKKLAAPTEKLCFDRVLLQMYYGTEISVTTRQIELRTSFMQCAVTLSIGPSDHIGIADLSLGTSSSSQVSEFDGVVLAIYHGLQFPVTTGELELQIPRSSSPEVFLGKGVLKYAADLQENSHGEVALQLY